MLKTIILREVLTMKKGIFALMDEDKILYTIGVCKNHVFREYPDGRIEKANDQEIEIASKFF